MIQTEGTVMLQGEETTSGVMSLTRYKGAESSAHLGSCLRGTASGRKARLCMAPRTDTDGDVVGRVGTAGLSSEGVNFSGQ